ncbi:hypothetical protein JCM16303_002186 [Sporobolomyces ruberrimus]
MDHGTESRTIDSSAPQRALEEDTAPSGALTQSATSSNYVTIDKGLPPFVSRDAPAPSRLLSLPSEVLCTILDHVPLTRTLATCALVYKTLLPFVLRRLYRTLVLRSSTPGRASSSTAPTILDEKSQRIFGVLKTSVHDIYQYPTVLDFDLGSHHGVTFSQIGSTLSGVLARCRNIVEIKLGKGIKGHGMAFSALEEMLTELEREPDSPESRLKALTIEDCVGDVSTLANVFAKLPRLVDLRVGTVQLLFVPSDLRDLLVRPYPRLTTFSAKDRLLPSSFHFLASSSFDTLRSLDVPISERNGLDLSQYSALVDVTLSLSLTSSLTSSTTQTSYFSNQRSSVAASQSPVSLAAPSLWKLATNFSSTLESIPFLSHLTIKGDWDVGDPEPLDIVRHANLLSFLPTSLKSLSIKTELNSIALVEWMDGMTRGAGEEGKKESKVEKLRVWQKTTFSSTKKEFQKSVREKVQNKANEKGIVCEWYKYDKW